MQFKKANQRQILLIDMISLSIALLAFYSLWLGCHPLFLPDEGRYSLIAREMLTSHDYITPRLNGIPFLDKPILFYWLQVAAMKAFGVNEWALRLFPALIGIVGCLITYITGRQLFDRRTALLSAIILATSPLFFGNAHYANLDLEVAVFISCSLLFFITGLQTKHATHTKQCMLAGYVFSALAFLTKGLIAIVFPAAILFTWMALLNRWHNIKRMHVFTGVIVFLGIAAPWYLLVQQANPDFFHFFFIHQQFSRFLSTNTFNNPSPAWFYLPVVFIGFFPWTAFLFQALSRALKNVWLNRKAYSTELFLLLWIGVIFTFFSTPHSKIIGYILPIFPPLALLTGRYISTHWENNTFKLGNILFIILCLLTAGLLLAATEQGWFELIVIIKSHIYLIATLLTISVIAAIFMLKQNSFLPMFVLCALTSTTVLITVLNRAEDLNLTTAKPLIEELVDLKEVDDEVVNYFKFYHDVPLFLGEPVTLVADWQSANIAKRDNWVRELWYGMPKDKQDEHLINEETFWQRFHSSKRVFVFLNSNYFDQFKARAGRYYIIGTHHDIILLSNKMN